MKSILRLTVWAEVGIGMIMEAVQQNEPLRTCLHVYGVVMKRAICRPHTWLWFVKRTCVSPSLLHLLKGYILFKAIFATANAKCISLVSQRLNFRRSSQIRFFCQSKSKISQ